MVYLLIAFLDDIPGLVHELACADVREERKGRASHRRDVIQLEAEFASASRIIRVSQKECTPGQDAISQDIGRQRSRRQSKNQG